MLEFDAALSVLKRDTASGSDGLTVPFLLLLLATVARKNVMLIFMNLCFLRGEIPNEWRQSELYRAA